MERNNHISNMNKNQCMQLIKLYGRYRLLWDANDPDYVNKTARINAWKDITRQMNLPMIELRLKMSSLLGSYRREKSRENRTKRANADPKTHYKSNWYAYDAFKFMMDKVPVKNRRDDKSDNEDSTKIKQEPQDQDQLSNTEGENDKDHLLFDFDPKMRSDHEFDNRTQYDQGLTDDGQMQIKMRCNQMSDVASNEDEFDLFGRSMAYQLKKLPEYTALELMQLMQTMVYEKRKQFYEMSSSETGASGIKITLETNQSQMKPDTDVIETHMIKIERDYSSD